MPSEEAPFTATLVAQACIEAGEHPSAIALLAGDTAMISDRLLRSTVVRKISLTGSVPAGRALLRAAAENIIPTTMELGGRATEHKCGYYYRPTVLGDTSPGMAIMTEEPFAPVAPISQFDDIDQVLEQANSTPYGLASAASSNLCAH